MKQFFKMMFASALGLFVAIGLLIVIAFSLLAGIAAGLNMTPTYTPTANAVLKIPLRGILSENSSANPFSQLLGDGEETLSLKEVLSAIRLAKTEEQVKGIYLEAGMLSAGSASLKAIRETLADFRASGKFVIAYADNYTQGAYYLCSVADRVLLNPQGILQLSGLASQTMFYKGLLEKVGVEMQVFKVGTYKGAVEPFMRDRLSDANREQITAYLSSVWGILTEEIAESRDIPVTAVNRFADEGQFFAAPAIAVERGLIDSLAYRSDVEQLVRERAGQPAGKLTCVTPSQINTLEVPAADKSAQIAILYAEGEIVPYAPTAPYDTQKRITEKLGDELAKQKDNEQVKAVVLRVNSPGGSAFVSDQIWKQVTELKKKKPVVVSMGDVAASGGYYISCAADRIIAEPNTLTGSIGIFGLFPNAAGLFDKLALTTDVVKTNRFAALGDVSRPMTEEEKALIQSYIERGYDTFLSRCAEGRGKSKEAIDAVGQGRVWTGEQAVEKGLVDELGGIDLAIREAARLAAVEDYSLLHVSDEKDFLSSFLEKQLGGIRTELARQLLGEDYGYFENLRQARTLRGIQARLPFDFKPL